MPPSRSYGGNLKLPWKTLTLFQFPRHHSMLMNTLSAVSGSISGEWGVRHSLDNNTPLARDGWAPLKSQKVLGEDPLKVRGAVDDSADVSGRYFESETITLSSYQHCWV